MPASTGSLPARNPMARVPGLSNWTTAASWRNPAPSARTSKVLYPEPNLMGVNAEERAFVEIGRQAGGVPFAGNDIQLRPAHAPRPERARESANFPTSALPRATRCWKPHDCSIHSLPIHRAMGIADDRFTDCRHHRVLRHRVRQTGQVQARRRAGLIHLAAWRDRMAERPKHAATDGREVRRAAWMRGHRRGSRRLQRVAHKSSMSPGLTHAERRHAGPAHLR